VRFTISSFEMSRVIDRHQHGPLSWPGDRGSARNGHSDISDNARADDDGMSMLA
jgi:hypothetical protein